MTGQMQTGHTGAGLDPTLAVIRQIEATASGDDGPEAELADICAEEEQDARGESAGDDAGEEADDEVETAGEDAPAGPQDWGYDVERLNRMWAMVLIGSQAVMVREQPTGKVEDRIRVIKIEAFRHMYSNRFTQIVGGDGKIKTVTWAKRWEGDRKRRQFDGVEFFPDPASDAGTTGYLNLWQGFSYTPDASAGSYAIFRDHVLTNICRGDEALFRWVFGWFAHMMQRPRERPGTAVVVRGLMGTGKSIMGEVIGSLIAPHYFQVDDPRYITGQFNAHMSACLLLQAEEAVWAGDKVAEGRLKGLITSRTQMIESKGVDPYRLDNYVRVLMTSNEDWVVPAGKDERRYCVLDVAENVKENHEYFGEMFEELDNGGRSALLADLLAFDLSSVNLRQIPRTDALLEQKLRSLDSVDQFLFDRLWEGSLLAADDGWPPLGEVLRETLHKEYLEAADKIGIKRRADQRQFGRALNRIIPDLKDIRPRSATGVRKRAYVFPPLTECRQAFERAVGQPVTWPSEDMAGAQSAYDLPGETGW